MSKISPLQKARSEYSPKLPPVLQECGPFATARLGEPTQSVADQDAICRLFPDTYGMPAVTFACGESFDCEPIKAGVILSGGPGPPATNKCMPESRRP